MAQHDYVIANQSGSAFRADLNNALAASVSTNSGSSAPSTTYAYMLWADTTNGVLKIRNSANNAWIELLQLDGTLTMEDGVEATPGLAFRDDLNTGIWSSAADTFNISTGGTERLELGAATVFNESGADVDFRIEGDSDANLFYVDAGNDRIGISTTTPDTLLHLEATNTSVAINNAIRISDKDTAVVANQVCGRIEFETADTGNPGVNCQIDTIYSGSGGGGELQIRTGFAGSLVDALRIDDTGQKIVQNGKLNINSTYIDFSGSLGSAPTTAAAIYRPADNNLAFSTANTERLRILNGGGITFNGNTAADSALDDYEEGYWDMTCNNTLHTSYDRGWYVKIGHMVNCGAYVRSDQTTDSTDALTFTLPFATSAAPSGGDTGWIGACSTNNFILDSGRTQTCIAAGDATSTSTIRQMGDSVTWVAMGRNQFTDGRLMQFTLTYKCA